MPSTLFPLPITVSQLKRQFSGLGDVLGALEEYTGQTVDEIAAEEIRKAQFEIETKTRMPYFVTRYCTREVAAYPDGNEGGTPLVIGTDFDRILEPLDYIVADWQQGSGRVTLPWTPIDEIELYRFSFANQGQIVDLPLTWINKNDMHGAINLMPHGLGINETQYFRLLLLFPFYRGSLSGTVIPNIIHIRYTAGLVDARLGESDEYDETAALNPEKQTNWDQGLVMAFQRGIAEMASAPILRNLANEIDRGGASISFAGLSESVNPGTLEDRADRNEQRATKWAEDLRSSIIGPVFVLV